MRLFEGKIILTLEGLKALIKYYGEDCPVAVVISSNICPNDQKKLLNKGRMYKQIDWRFEECSELL